MSWLAWALPVAAWAAVPAVVNVEAALKSAGGGPASDGSYKVTFALYKDALGGTPVWSEPGVVAVQGGAFSHLLGTAVPLKAELLASMPQVWFSATVEGDPELPRRPLASVPFSLRAGMADGLDCTGCVTVGMLDPAVLQPYAKKADLAKVATSGSYADLQGAPDMTVYAKVAQLAKVAASGSYGDLTGTPDLAAYAKVTDLAGVAFTGKYADLNGTPTLAKLASSGSYADLKGAPPLGSSCGTGLVLQGFKADGSYDCVASLDPKNLPKDALGVVSNGLLVDVIPDTVSNTTPVAIKDNNPIGVTSSIAWPDFGVAQGITVTVDISNSDTKSLKLLLLAPDGSSVTLYDKSAAGTAVKSSWTDKSTLPEGALADWVGKNPKGTWTLTAVDTGFLNNGNDGAINSWTLSVQTLSGKKIQAFGGLQFFNSASDPLPCTPAQAGLSYYNTKANAVYICNGNQYFPLALTPFGTQQNPASSCNDLLAKAPGTPDGQYYITLNGATVQVTCDMTKDGGGWTALELESVGSNATAIAAGWTDGSLTNATVAGAATVVHGMWGSGGGGSKTYTTPPHTQMRVTGRYYAVDSWDGEANGAQMIVDGNLKWSATKSWNAVGSGSGWTSATFTPAPWGNNNGPNGYWTLAAAIGNGGILAHNGGTLKLEFRTGLDQAASDESFAYSHIQLWVK